MPRCASWRGWSGQPVGSWWERSSATRTWSGPETCAHEPRPRDSGSSAPWGRGLATSRGSSRPERSAAPQSADLHARDALAAVVWVAVGGLERDVHPAVLRGILGKLAIQADARAVEAPQRHGVG